MAHPNIRIGFLIKDLGIGGAEEVSRRTAHLFLDQGLSVCFIVGRWVREQFVVPEGAEVVELPGDFHITHEATRDRIIEAVDEHRISLLFILESTPPLIQGLRQHCPTCKLIYWHHSSPFFEKRIKINRRINRARKSVVSLLIWHLFKKFQYQHTGYLDRLLEHTYREQVDLYDKIIVLCEEYKEIWCKRLSLGAEQRNKIVSMTNTIEIEPSPNRKKEKTILYVGRLSEPDKQVSHLIRIWALAHTHLPEWSLHLYGSGADAERYARMIDAQCLPRIEMKGYTTDPQEQMRPAAVLCLTSAYEGWPLVMVEAQNQCCIPIAYDVSGGVREIVEADKACGRLVTPNAPQEFADKLVELCRDIPLMEEIRGRILEKRLSYGPNINNAKWHALFRELFGSQADRLFATE